MSRPIPAADATLASPGRIHDAASFTAFVLRRWVEDRCPQVAASLTFTTLLALAPVFAIAVALLSSAPFFEQVMVQVKIFLLMNLVPEIAGRIITDYMVQLEHNAGRLTTFGVALLLVTAVTLMLTIDRSFNAIWRVRRRRPYWVSVLAYFFLMLAGPVLIGLGVTITTYVMTLSAGVRVAEAANPALLRFIPLVFSALTFFLLYRIVPHRRVAWTHAAVGGAIAALLFEAAKELFAIYVRSAPTYNVLYGAFAALPFFLLWIYLSWLVILFGAELTAALDYWKSRVWTHAPKHDPRFGYAVAVARRLFEARGAPVSFEHLRMDTGMPVDQLEDALHHMTASGLVEHVGRDGYAIRERGAPPPPAKRPRRARRSRREKMRP
ncbi:MAG: YihY family inner membrane protein [Betaproteobacteria bacterium]